MEDGQPVGVELFAGAGGMSEGIRRAQVGVAMRGFDADVNAVDTAQKAGHETTLADVREALDLFAPDSLEYLHASPPCQSFAQSGKGAGRRALDTVLGAAETLAFDSEWDDERTGLVLEPLRWITMIRPRLVSLEQVPTVLPVWEAYAGMLERYGYQTWTGFIDAETLGVPQTRRRAFLMASLDGPVSPPQATHSRYHRRSPQRLDEGVLPWVSMAQALGWEDEALVGFPRLDDGKGSVQIDGVAYRARDLRSSDAPSVSVTEKIRSWRRYPVAAVEGDTSWVHRRPSPTIVGSFSPDVVAAPGYRKAGDGPRQKQPGSVRIALEEAAILQGFPADYPWQGSRTSRFLQCGNAVCPPVGEAVVRALFGAR